MASKDAGQQTDLSQWRAGRTTEEVTKTIVLRLETSRAKRQRIQQAIDDFAEMCRFWAIHIPSYPEHEWQLTNPQFYRHMKRAFPKEDRALTAKSLTAAYRKVTSAFLSWQERNDGSDPPTEAFSGVEYIRADNQQFEIVENDRGLGLRLNVYAERGRYEWFHIVAGEYQRELLRRLVDEDDSASAGTIEISIDDNGDVVAHLPVSWDVDVFEPGDVQTAVGVDLGESVLWTAAVLDGDGVAAVEMEPGDEFRHYRERLDAKRERLSEQGDLQGVRATKGDRRRYTEQVTHTASRQIIDLAVEHTPCVIRLEDLTHYRETADDPIHDWPFAMPQEQIAYKATEAGVPVETVDAAQTSITCRRCGETNPQMRDGDEFECWECGYEVHADVNAAINIAGGGVQ